MRRDVQSANGPADENDGDVVDALPLGGLGGLVSIGGVAFGWVRKRRRKRERLAELVRESRARSIDRWVGAGLTRDEAVGLADDPSIAAVPSGLVIPDDGRLVVLMGSAGSGKSHTAEALFRRAVHRAQQHRRSQVPVFIPAGRITGSSVREMVKVETRDLGRPGRRGFFVVVDGAEQAGVLELTRLVSDCRVLCETWSSTRVIVTTRAVHNLAAPDEVVEVAGLPEPEALALIGRVGGQVVTTGMAYSWPRPIREVLQLPLYALFLGKHLQRGRAAGAPTRHGLLSNVASAAAAAFPGVGRDMELVSCAWLDVSRPLADREIPDGVDVDRLIGAGLVTWSGDRLDLPVSLLGQWYGAQALRKNSSLLLEVITGPIGRRERWRFAISMAIEEEQE